MSPAAQRCWVSVPHWSWGTATIAAANPPVSMDGYLYAGTYSSTTACMQHGDRLRRQSAIRDYFCHPVKRVSWLYVDPIEDD